MTTAFLAEPSPRLPSAGLITRGSQAAVAGLLHLLAAVTIVVTLPSGPPEPAPPLSPTPPPYRVVLPRIVFVPAGLPGAGGGGGGHRQAGPIRRAEGVGRDAATLRTARRVAPAVDAVGIETTLPPVLLDARPLASGSIDVIGLPVGGVTYGTSTGPGSGGGVGTGSGTGIGPGHGPGIGSGSGGGFGGGAYRPGGVVTAPRVLSEVKPRYTSQALVDKIQGSVWLELIVTREGRVDQIRVVRSLDPRGLDNEAINAVREWRFEPGRLAGTPVDVLVTVAIDFWIR